MKILLHSCCGPCTLYPLSVLREEGHEVDAFFYNPNIHPYREFKKRINGLKMVAEKKKLEVLIDHNYGLTRFLQKVVFNEEKRCGICYELRLSEAAKQAANLGFDGFSSTLLYSRYQNHELMRQIGQKMAADYGVEFVYHDFRLGWQRGIDESIELDIYRQPYCGCIYSEQERYDKKFRKNKVKLER